MNKNSKSDSAIRHGFVGAVIGAVVMSILSIWTLIEDSAPFHYIFIYPICGVFYGFGLTFANWKQVLRNTKKGAIEGTAGLGIGIILSRWTGDKKWNMYGWLFFGFRIAWHFGFCWIPGIWYGIQAIRMELNERLVAVFAHTVPQAVEVSDVSAYRSEAFATDRPSVVKNSHAPMLSCLSGTFAGAEFPLKSGEVITFGTDSARCQIVLNGDGIQREHCRLWFNYAFSNWYVLPLSSGITHCNGARILPVDDVCILPRGTVLSFGQGQSCQQFRLE